MSYLLCKRGRLKNAVVEPQPELSVIDAHNHLNVLMLLEASYARLLELGTLFSLDCAPMYYC